MLSQRERAEIRRKARLEDVERQVASGGLTVRQMTEEERKRYPPRDAPPPRRNRWAR